MAWYKLDHDRGEGRYCFGCGAPLIILKAKEIQESFDRQTGQPSQPFFELVIGCSRASWWGLWFGGHTNWSGRETLAETPIKGRRIAPVIGDPPPLCYPDRSEIQLYALRWEE